MTTVSNTAAETARDLIDSLPSMTPEIAMWCIARLMNDHNFTGAVITPDDVREMVADRFWANEIERDVTTADVTAMLQSWEWQKGIGVALWDRATEMMDTAYDEAFNVDGSLKQNVATP